MKQFKARLLALSALMVLTAAAFVPMAVQAQQGYCPIIVINCGPFKGGWRSCYPQVGYSTCTYNQSCLNCA